MESPRLRIKRQGVSGGKVWHVCREDFTLPLGSFYDFASAVRYADKTIRLHRAGRHMRRVA